jgi:DNA modification methylase
MKLTKEDIDKVRNIEGFPISKDEDIIALSNPTYYTACPNPFIEDFIKEYGKPYDEEKDDYNREPFAADVSEGKNDPIYNAHSYHTKVPHKAIMKYILHYTNPGDIIFDGFCGSGMTGVAAQVCDNPEPEHKIQIESEMKNVLWGARKTILNDLSPAATFITSNYNGSVDINGLEKEARQILNECEEEYGWMYMTRHVADIDKKINSSENKQFNLIDVMQKNMSNTDYQGNNQMGKINYTIMSDVLICPNCSENIILWDVAVDNEDGEVKEKFYCNHCQSELTKRNCEKSFEVKFDKKLNKTVKILKQVPVLINYKYKGKRYDKAPDDYDRSIIEKIENMEIENFYPVDRMCVGKESRRNDKSGIKYVHQFYSNRNLHILSLIFSKCKSNSMKFIFTACTIMGTKMSRYGKRTGNVSGTLYIPSLVKELNMFEFIDRKLYGAKGIIKPLQEIAKFGSNTIISTGSLTDMSNIPVNSIDYIFTDPPFGDNLNYSELSYIWESWLKITTNNKMETVVNSAQQKGLLEYQNLMTQCFNEYFRVLKPGRWITVEFHNSKNGVWMAIQESLNRAGFVIADVRTLDKKQGSFKQVTTTSAVKQDLVITAYKPKDSFKRAFISHAGSEDTVWDFVRQHIERLPVVVTKNGKIELNTERQAYLLFDRMIAYHIMNGISVPMDAVDFYKGLDEKFLKRDGMYFLHDQVNEYDTARITTDVENVQMAFFVSDEKTAIAWLYQQLNLPQTYAELQPKFMQEIRSIEKYERLPELSVLLEDNFIQNEVGQWYIPDVTKSADVAKLREKKLLKEFEEYLNSTGKLKLFRTEAIRAGFAKLWKEKNYGLIVKTADRLPESVIQEDDKLLMYYDISLSRV